MHMTPAPGELLPMFHPAELLQASGQEFLVTYVVLAIFLGDVLLKLLKHNSVPCTVKPTPAHLRWLPIVMYSWGIQSISLLIRDMPISTQYVRLDIFISLTALIVITLAVAPAVFQTNRNPQPTARIECWSIGAAFVAVTTLLVDFVFVSLSFLAPW